MLFFRSILNPPPCLFVVKRFSSFFFVSALEARIFVPELSYLLPLCDERLSLKKILSSSKS